MWYAYSKRSKRALGEWLEEAVEEKIEREGKKLKEKRPAAAGLFSLYVCKGTNDDPWWAVEGLKYKKYWEWKRPAEIGVLGSKNR